jgi:hypothetical protein
VMYLFREEMHITMFEFIKFQIICIRVTPEYTM